MEQKSKTGYVIACFTNVFIPKHSKRKPRAESGEEKTECRKLRATDYSLSFPIIHMFLTVLTQFCYTCDIPLPKIKINEIGKNKSSQDNSNV